MKNFEDKLKSILNEEVETPDRIAMKARLMQTLHYKDSFWRSVKHVVSGVKPTVNSRVIMKEKLFAMVEGSSTSFWQMFAPRKLTASIAAFALLFVAIVQPFTSVTSVRANVFTRVVSYSGEVKVLRGGSEIGVDSDMPLNEGDTLVTGPAGFVEVRFSDDNLVRLGSSSKLVMKEFENPVSTQVELQVLEGEVWSNVIGVYGEDSYFKFVSNNLSGRVTSASTFDVAATDAYTRVVAISRPVSLKLAYDGDVVPANLSAGQMVKVKKETPYLSYLDKLAFEERVSEVDMDWFASNIRLDQIYKARLAADLSEQRKKEAGITPDSFFYPVKELGRATRLALAVSPEKKSALELKIANQKILEAEVMISKGDRNTADALLAQSQQKFEKVTNQVNQLKMDEPESSKKIEAELNNAVLDQKKSFKTVLPSDEAYEVKQAVNTVELIVAGENTAAKAKVSINQAQEALDEAQDLVDAGEDDLAIKKLDEYAVKIDAVAKDVEALPEAQQGEVALKLIENNTQSIVTLDSVGEKAGDKVELSEKVTEAKTVSADNVLNTTQVIQKSNNPLDPELNNKIEQVTKEVVPATKVQTETLIIDQVSIPGL